MNKSISFIILSFLCAFLSGCDDDKTPEIIFSEVSNTAPDHVQFLFSSLDPGCMSRRGIIYADQFGGQLTIKSTNVPSISLGYMPDPANNFYIDPVEGGDNDPDYRYSEQGQWSVRLINNTLVFDFEPVDADDTTTNGAWYYLPVSATVNGKVVNICVLICRTYDYSFYDKLSLQDKEIKTEDDIEYYELCPINKYSIAGILQPLGLSRYCRMIGVHRLKDR